MMYSKSGENWFAQHVTVNGQLNVDLGFSDKTRLNPFSAVSGPTGFFVGTTLANVNKGSSDISLYNSNVSVDVQPINWVSGHIEVTGQENYRNNVGVLRTMSVPFVALDEAYAMLGDLTQSPFYMTAGLRYMPFGYYNDPHVLTPSLTQLLTQVQDTSIQVGYAQPCGFHASGYVFRGLLQAPVGGLVATDRRANINNGGLDVGYAWGDGQGMRGFDAGVSWLYNMSDVLAVQSRYNAAAAVAPFGWTSATGGIAARLGGYYMNFDGSVDYVSALRRFNVADTVSNIQPSAVAAQVGYGFRYMGHEHRIGLGYQQSFSTLNAVASLGLAQRRYQADWTVGLAPSTKLQFQYTHDRDFSVAAGGTGLNANTGQVRLSVGFL
jgi:hypothetical protein